MPAFFHNIDLSHGSRAEDFFVSLIEDRFKMEAWRASPQCFDRTIPSSNWCAMTCLRMLLLLQKFPSPSLEKLFEDACTSEVYVWDDGADTENIGWRGCYHKKLAVFIRQYGFEAHHRTSLVTGDIADALDNDWFVIPSVSPEIRFPHRRRNPIQRNGHVVLVYAYRSHKDESNRSFLIQNAAGFASKNSQIGVRISERRMQQVFGGHATFVRLRM
jgi:hypothetical protein